MVLFCIFQCRTKAAAADFLSRQGCIIMFLTEILPGCCVKQQDALNVKGMMSNRRLSRSISDMGFHEFRRQLTYKTSLRENHLEIVDRWFPSTKRCSRCLELNKTMTLADRDFDCKQCGLLIDRDENAARNLWSTVSSTGIYAFGEKGSGLCENMVKPEYDVNKNSEKADPPRF